MKQKLIYMTILVAVFVSCTQEWDKHYTDYPETVNQNIWDAMANEPEISDFYNILKGLNYDTLFISDIPYTVFMPTNEAVSQYKIEHSIDSIGKELINYHISSHFIQSGNIDGVRQIQTFTKKFALFERLGTGMKLDGIEIMSESPLYRNGKFFIIGEVAQPRPNFYEFYAVTNPMLRDYIDSKDSIIIDRERSEPIGFDEQGRTIYDTVAIRYNKFEDEFFPVRTEFRTQGATIVFPVLDDYDQALTNMALKLNIPGYNDYNDIPKKWQQEILFPVLLKHGVFENRLEPEEFTWEPGNNQSGTDLFKLKNIQGDSVFINYTPVNKVYCSNGYAYSYDNFEVPDSLYLGNTRYEGEWLVRRTGINRFAWREEATVDSDVFFAPTRSYNSDASNDSILTVIFPRGYNDQFSVEFSVPNIFPLKQLLVVRTHMDIGGVYDIYVNDVLVREGFDFVEYTRQRGIINSVTGARYIPQGRLNKFDMYVENIDTYGDAKIRFEYKGPGTNVPENGLVIDYIDLIPVFDN